MTLRARAARRLAATASALAGALLLAACSSSGYAPTAVPAPTSSPTASGSGSAAAPAACNNATQSYDPLPGLTGSTADAAVQAIRAKGYLRAGVSADSLLLGSRNPVTGQIEGFDIDVVRAIAQAIFGDPSKVQLVVIQSSDRIPVLQNDTVDVVVRNMSMTCSRWSDIAFSAEYFQSGLKILVPKGSDVTSLAALSGKKVCAPNSTSTMDVVRATAGVKAVGAATHTGCLVLFQQGEVDAIAGDDTVLAGLAAQDPYAYVPTIAPLTSEPYGVGIKKDRVDLVRYVNTVLAQMKADGRWTASYNQWFAKALGPAPQPPTPVYGQGGVTPMSLELSPPPPPSTGAAPEAPGRLGTSVSPQEAFVFLRDLGMWRDHRKDELDALDSAALASSDRDAFSRDMLVSMALWKAISDRYDLLEVTFDNGRVGAKEAERLSALIWGRLDVAPGSAAGTLAPSVSGALALTLPEACRLSDAMTSSLRARLSLEPSGAEVGTRLRSVRETVERIRDQIDTVPAGTEREAAGTTLQRLDHRLAEVTEKAKRGADVGGLLAPLEYDASTAERDLIVGAGQRLDAARDAERGRAQRSELAARGAAIRLLADQCVAAVTPAPTLAIPDVTALGEVPTDLKGVETYLRRLDAVSRALTAAQSAYAGALAERDELVGISGAYQAQARATGATGPDLDELASRLETTFAATPTNVRRARALVAAYQAYVRSVTTHTQGAKR